MRGYSRKENLWVGAILAAVVMVGCGDDPQTEEDLPRLPPTMQPDASGADMDPATDPDMGQVVVEPDMTVTPSCTSHGECTEDPAGPYCDPQAGACAPLPPGHLIGWGEGGQATITEVYRPQMASEAPDLDFHPMRDELWVVNRHPEVAGVCSQNDPQSARCRSLGGFTTILTRPGQPDQQVQILEDGNSWHFMRRPPAIAMGTPDRFATCGEASTGNFEDNDVKFIGPTLWSSDLSVYAQPSGGNGSHLDMLHATPWCMGIAHEQDNVYWVFNGDAGSLDRYDFQQDHGPGADDHSDGKVHRYAAGTVGRVPNVPSHMVFHPGDSHLYVADTGNGRIIKLDTTSGQKGGAFSPVYEPLADYGTMTGAQVSDVVASGTLVRPSGLALHDDILYVSDNQTGRIHAFTLAGEEVQTLDTELPAGALAGLAVGPQGKLWFTDMSSGAVYRIDPAGAQ